MGFSTSGGEVDYDKMKEMVTSEVKKTFNPEFINRLDELIVFNTLGKNEIIQIIDLILSEVMDRLKDKNMKLVIEDEVKEYLAEVGFTPEFGARPLRRAVQRHIEDKIALDLLSRKFVEGDTIRIYLENGVILTERIEDSILRSIELEDSNEKSK